MKVKKAVIPVAGFGTRFLPMTKATPKEMLNIVDKPAIQYVVEEAVASGIEEILIITTRHRSSVENHFDASPELERLLYKQGKFELLEATQKVSDLANIFYKRQSGAKGLGHAILQAKAFVGDEFFAVLLADDIIDNSVPCLRQLMDLHERTHGSVLGVQVVSTEDVSKYGIVEGTATDHKTWAVKGLIEKPEPSEAPSNIAVLGRYILSPTIFGILENTEPGVNDEIQLTDALVELSDKEPMVAYDFEGKRYDTGTKLGYLKATVEMALKHDEVKDAFKAYIETMIK